MSWFSRFWAWVFRKPYLAFRFDIQYDGTIGGDPEFNKQLIKKIDEFFLQNPPAGYDRSLDDRSKVLVYLGRAAPLYFCNAAKNVANAASLSYLMGLMEYREDGSLALEAIFNRHAIYDIDQRYKAFDRNDYDTAQPDAEKAKRFIADMMFSTVEEYQTEEVSLDEVPEDAMLAALNQVPALRGNPVSQTVDLADNLDRAGASG